MGRHRRHHAVGRRQHDIVLLQQLRRAHVGLRDLAARALDRELRLGQVDGLPCLPTRAPDRFLRPQVHLRLAYLRLLDGQLCLGIAQPLHHRRGVQLGDPGAALDRIAHLRRQQQQPRRLRCGDSVVLLRFHHAGGLDEGLDGPLRDGHAGHVDGLLSARSHPGRGTRAAGHHQKTDHPQCDPAHRRAPGAGAASAACVVIARFLVPATCAVACSSMPPCLPCCAHHPGERSRPE